MKILLLKTLPALSLAILLSVAVQAQPEGPVMASGKPLFDPVEKTIYFNLGNKNIPVKIIQYGNDRDMVYINLHDSEPTSYEAARKLLQFAGGTLIKIENKQRRNIRFQLNKTTYSFDPNRIFSRVGIEQTLRESGKTSKAAIAEVEKFSNWLLQLIPETTSCIVSLHNNTDGDYSVKTYLPGGKRRLDAKAVYEDSLQDIDDIILTTDSLLFNKMANCCYNAILQDNVNVKKDGSLSVYFGERNRRYINIETEHGKIDKHLEMLEKLLFILSDHNSYTFTEQEISN